jgi:hypothetical protein
VNAPKFFLHRASNEIALLQVKPQINKLHHEWIQVRAEGRTHVLCLAKRRALASTAVVAVKRTLSRLIEVGVRDVGTHGRLGTPTRWKRCKS